MLSIAFGQSKYFVDNLRENIKRGQRQKLRNGVWPGWAPLGYENDRVKKTIIVDDKTAPLIRKMFQLYATGDYGFQDLAILLSKQGLKTRFNGPIAVGNVQKTLSNPFYYGLIRYNGELYPAAHKPIISKRLFDECQAVMARRGRPQAKHNKSHLFGGLMKCSCGCYITAEVQKGHTYYRCTKKKGFCPEKGYLREEALVEQIKEIYKNLSLPDDWTDKMLVKLEEDREHEARQSVELVTSLTEQIKTTDTKLDRLLDSHLEGVIETSEYKNKKEKLIGQRVSSEQRIEELRQKGSFWLEPMKEFLLRNKEAKILADRGEPAELRAFLKNIGSNFLLKGRKLGYEAKIGWSRAGDFRSFTDWCPEEDSNLHPLAGTSS